MEVLSSAVARQVARCSALWVLARAGVAAPEAEGSPPCRTESGSERLVVLELYTSEGCSSCPPADRWLSREFGEGRTAHGAVPLAFHVDYWNRLGWPDRFSRPEFSARQQTVAARGGKAVIYTPQFVLDGQDVKPGQLPYGKDSSWGPDAAGPSARITMWTGTARDGSVRVQGRVAVDDPGRLRRAEARVALTQNRLESQVTAGENGGRRLHHDHVVRAWSGPYLPDAAGDITFDVRLPRPAEFRADSAAVVVFVEDAGTGRTLQALSAPICRD